MKVGYTEQHKNLPLQPGSHWRTQLIEHPNTLNTFARLYPDELFAWINPLEPDLDMCSQLDVLIHWSGYPDFKFVHWMDKIPCPIICAQHTGPGVLLKEAVSKHDILLRKEIMDKSDAVMVLTRDHIPFFSLWTDTPIFYMPTPICIDLMLEFAAEANNAPQCDIVIPYCPYERYSDRNSLMAAMLAQKIVNEVDGFDSVCMFNADGVPGGDQFARELLSSLGCKDITVFPRVGLREFIQIFSKAKMGISLDRIGIAGKFAIDCAVLQKPAILTDMLPYAKQIYGDIRVQHPLDVDTAMETARRVAAGEWPESWLDRAAHRVDEFRFENCAKQLEKAVSEVRK